MTVNESYQKFVNYLMKTPFSPPDAETLYKMVELRVSPEEAEFLVKIPIRRSTLNEISQKTGIPAEELIKKLDELAMKGVIYRIKGKVPSENLYSLADVMFGWYRMPWWSGKKDDYHRDLAPITNKYYIDQLATNLTGYPTQFLRSVPINQTVEDPRTILPYEDVVKLIDSFEYYAVSECACRHRHNLDPIFNESKYPMHVCLHFDHLGKYTVDVGVGEEITREETLEILKNAADAGLVHAPNNVIEGVDTICNCDPEYCLWLEPTVKMPGIVPRGHQHSNYIREIDEEKCIKCGLCAKKCPIGAIEFIKEEKKLIFTPERCLGCGVCAHKCPEEAITMKKRDEEVDFPHNWREYNTKFLEERGFKR